MSWFFPGKRFLLMFLVFSMAFALFSGGCSKSDDSSDDSKPGDSGNPDDPGDQSISLDVTLSGNVSSPGTSASVTNISGGFDSPLFMTTDLSDYKLYCLTFSDPPQAGVGDFVASGSAYT